MESIVGALKAVDIPAFGGGHPVQSWLASLATCPGGSAYFDTSSIQVPQRSDRRRHPGGGSMALKVKRN